MKIVCDESINVISIGAELMYNFFGYLIDYKIIGNFYSAILLPLCKSRVNELRMMRTALDM